MVLNNSNWHMYHCKQGKRLPLTGEKFTKPSLAVPNQTLSLRQLVERYSMGASVEVFNGTYTTDPVFDNLERLDKVERQQLAKEVGAGISRGQRILANRANSAKQDDSPSPAEQEKPLSLDV